MGGGSKSQALSPTAQVGKLRQLSSNHTTMRYQRLAWKLGLLIYGQLLKHNLEGWVEGFVSLLLFLLLLFLI